MYPNRGPALLIPRSQVRSLPGPSSKSPAKTTRADRCPQDATTGGSTEGQQQLSHGPGPFPDVPRRRPAVTRVEPDELHAELVEVAGRRRCRTQVQTCTEPASATRKPSRPA